MDKRHLLRVFTFLGQLFVFHWLGFQWNRMTVAVAALLTFATTTPGVAEWFYVSYKTLPRDLHAAKLFFKFRWDVYKFNKSDGNIPDRFHTLVQKHPYRTCLIADGRKWTYKEVDEMSNRVANAFVSSGLVQGDVVALFMESKPEFVCIWLGLAKVGVVTALINYNLRMQSLAHTITTANAKALIFDSSLADAVVDILSLLPSGMGFYYYGADGDGRFPFANSLIHCMQSSRPTKPPKVHIKPSDRLIYIYTSGTTGLPKAAVITNLRYYFMASGPFTLMEFNQNDVFYTGLPVYHSMAGILAVGQAVCFGVPVVIRKKFSASQFWDDCIANKCTVTQYLGEICRYLLAQPAKPQDKAHSIRLMVGNGLRPKIWEQFVERFAVKKIFEFYSSTEGNATVMNFDSHPGAVGFISRTLPFVYPCTLIRVDEKTGTHLRDKNGFCIKCQPGEPGELVGKIVKGRPERSFDGYVSKEATAKKIIDNVFKKGDQAFATGDVLVMDRWGYLYFRDRTGDTFRWKGENVSTMEVEAVISNILNLSDAAVYGVEVPNCEGRAGMAAILDPTESVDLDKLYTGLVKELPTYARPLFIRLTNSLPMTGTFKLKKLELQNEGFDPLKCGQHKLYYLNGAKYSPLTQQVHEDIRSAKIRY